MGMAYELDGVLRVRTAFAVESERSLGKAKFDLQNAEVKLDREDSRLLRYRQKADERMRNVFSGVIGRVVRVHELNLMNAHLANIVREGAQIRKDRDVAASELKARQSEVVKARDRYFGARREREKIVEHKSAWQQESNVHEMRRNDAEMDDFRILKNER